MGKIPLRIKDSKDLSSSPYIPVAMSNIKNGATKKFIVTEIVTQSAEYEVEATSRREAEAIVAGFVLDPTYTVLRNMEVRDRTYEVDEAE